MAQIKLRYVNEYVDRTGKVRRYFRKGKGARRVALHGLPGSDEFMAAYQTCLAEDQQSTPPKTIRQAEGSFSRLVSDFYTSKGFKNDIKASSQALYCPARRRRRDQDTPACQGR